MSSSFNKFDYYCRAVQAPDGDADFFESTYKEITGKKLHLLGEDFCGTFAVSAEWVQRNKKNVAVGVDLDKVTLNYGRATYLPKLDKDEKSRLFIFNANVLSSKLPHVDCLAALNFSYFIFKKRIELKAYFENVYQRLNPGGVFFCDCFGGPGTQIPEEEKNYLKSEGFTYFWDQESFDPISHEALFKIHFQPKGDKKYLDAFTYDWRMWSIPEIRDLLDEVGFKKSIVYWEGTDEKGEGNGKYTATKSATTADLDSWVAVIAGVK